MVLDVASNFDETNALLDAGEVDSKAQAGMWSAVPLRYPVELIDVVALPDGQRITIRPVLPQDDAVTRTFFQGLSVTSRHNRFMSALQDVPETLLTQFTHIDYKAHLALISEIFVGGREIAVGEARYVMSENGKAAEFAVSIADDWQGRGLGTLLLKRLIKTAAMAGVERIVGETLASNTALMHLARKAGFSCERDPEIAGLVHLSLDLFGRDLVAR